jgi:tetratricopeptide (TPR) repeat protein
MKRTLLLVCVAAIAGCSRDPLAVSRKHIERGDGYFQDSKYKEAAIEYRNAEKAAPQTAAPHMKLGEVAMRTGDFESAVDEYLRAGSLEPQNAEAQVRAGSVYFVTGRFKDARARAEAALRLEPDNPDAHLVLGEVLAAQRDAVHSEAQLIEAIRLAPKSADAHVALGSLYWSTGRLTDAEAALKRAVAIAPALTPPNRALASFYLETNRPAQAEPALARLIANNPQDVAAILQRSHALALLGRGDEALAAVDAANRIEPESPRVMLARGYALVRQKRVDDGIWWALRARERHPDDFAPPLRLALAQVLETGGRREAAEHEYADILRKSPRNWIAANNLAVMYASDGRLDEAMKLARLASEEAPASLQVKNTLDMIAKHKSS